MAIALTAWLIAPAPIAWTSTRPLLRMTPAIAPATATGFEVAETLSTSTGVRSDVIAGTPSRMFTVDSLDRCGSAGGTVNGNQYGIECHGSRRHDEAVRDPAQEPLQDYVFVHPDAAVPGPDHAHIGDVGGPARQDPGVGRRDVGVGADHGAGPADQVPAHRGLLRRGFGVHVAEDDRSLRMGGQDRVGRPKRVIQGLEKDPPDQVHDQHLVAARVDHAPTLAWRRRRVVGRPEHALQAGQLPDELLLGEHVVAGRDHVRARGPQLGDDLARQAETSRGVLAVDDREVRTQLLLQRREARLDRIPARMPAAVGHEQDAELVARHAWIVVEKKKGAPRGLPFELTSRTPRPSSRAPR